MLEKRFISNEFKNVNELPHFGYERKGLQTLTSSVAEEYYAVERLKDLRWPSSRQGSASSPHNLITPLCRLQEKY